MEFQPDYYTQGANSILMERLRAILSALQALGASEKGLSSASKGEEREFFANEFLSSTIPSIIRIQSGDIIDLGSKVSGQVDIVLEFPFLPSFPKRPNAPRLYFAEGVCAAIEVKSDLKDQWDEVLKKVKAIKSLTRFYTNSRTTIPSKIPVFVVGYRGWRDPKTIKKRLEECELDGLLILDQEICYIRASSLGTTHGDPCDKFIKGPACLWGLSSWIIHHTHSFNGAFGVLLNYISSTVAVGEKMSINHTRVSSRVTYISEQPTTQGFSLSGDKLPDPARTHAINVIPMLEWEDL